MKKRGMKEFFILCTVIVILLTNSSLVLAQPQTGYQPQGLFNLQFVINITWGANETQTPIHPGEIREVQINIIYTVTHGAYGRILLRLLEDRPFFFRLSIGDKPDWCTTQLSIENFIGVINPDEIQCQTSTLSIQLSEDAPLNYTLGYVKIYGVIDDMKGPFNILTLIQGYESNVTLFFVTSP